MKVLVVDDTRTDLRIVTAHVRDLGHEVITAGSGEEALARYLADNPDLVLLDVVMPGMDGYTVARRIRELAGDDWVPIIFLSAMVEDEHIVRGIEVGGDDYLTKPPRQLVLKAKLTAMERIAHMRQSLIEVSGQLERANEELHRLSREDHLTGLANRRVFDERLAVEWQRARREQVEIALILADIDHFKAYNDHYGHQAGDQCLVQVAEALKGAARRPGDIAARYGGEEFAILLPATSVQEGARIAGQICAAIRDLQAPNIKSPTSDRVTTSFGVAGCVPSEQGSARALVAAADALLYQAKQAGRDRVVAAACGTMASALPLAEEG